MLKFTLKLLGTFLVIVLLSPNANFSALAGSLQQSSDQTQEKIYEPKEVDQRARIIRKPVPQYTEQARRNRTSAWVELRVVLKSSGEIGDKVIRDAPDGLTEECIRVAREIKFEPALKDGHPVSMYIKVQYTFAT